MKRPQPRFGRIGVLWVLSLLCADTSAQWVAVNDHASGPGTSPNATRYNVLGFDEGTTGPLRDVFTGELLPATLTISRAGILPTISVGGAPPVGSPLDIAFNGLVDFSGNPSNNNVGLSFTATATYTIANLNPDVDYILQGGAVRGADSGSDTNFWTLFELNGADSYVSAHTANAVTTAQIGTLLANQVAINTGRNHLPGQGDMFEWRSVRAGADGAVQIVCRRYNGLLPGGGTGGLNGFALTALKIIEYVETAPMVVIQPVSQEARIGESVTFQVTASGLPIHYQWQISPDGGVNWNDVPGETNAYYTITNLSLVLHQVPHRVRVFNNLGEDYSQSVVATIDMGPIELLPWGATWRYEISGMDLGTPWRQPGYDDSNWLSGPGPLGDESAALPVPLGTPYNKGSEITDYFRTTFELTNEPTEIELFLTNMIDDGAVFYLNGQEVLRVGMPEGPVDFVTAATVTVGEAPLMAGTVPAQAARKGVNTIAVEVHQLNTTSSDAVMGLNLWARLLPLEALSITRSPQDLIVEELAPAMFDVETEGNGARFQWYKNGLPIDGAIQSSLVFPMAAASDAGQYSVRVYNLLSDLMSESATLTVLLDTNPPVVIQVEEGGDAQTIRIEFSKTLEAVSALDPSHYEVGDTWGNALIVLGVELIDPTTVLLRTAPRGAGTNYLVGVTGVRDDTSSGNEVVEALRPVSRHIEIIGLTDPWRFYDPYPDLEEPLVGLAWTLPDYDDSFWGEGPAAFVFDLSGETYPVPEGTSLSGGTTRTHFRRTFALENSSLGARVRLRHLVDDGAVFYLNGTEVHRVNLAEGDLDDVSLASSPVNVAALSDFVEFDAETIQVGINTLAATLYDAQTLAADKVFAAGLDLRIYSVAAGPIVILESPGDIVVEEGDPIRASFDAVGVGQFQWYVGDEPVEGATNALLKVPSAPLAWDGQPYFVEVWNDDDRAESAAGLLTVLPDLSPPQMIAVAVADTRDRIALSFDEALEPASVMDLGHYQLTNRLSGVATIHQVTLEGGTNIVLEVDAVVGPDWLLVLNGIRDTSAAANAISPNTTIMLPYEGLLLPMTAIWKYDASRNNYGMEWTTAAFNDSTWPSGPGVFVAHASDPENENLPSPRVLGTALPYGIAGESFITNYYFRAVLPLGMPVSGMVIASNLLDDGAVFYVNGQEVKRIRMPMTDPIASTTLAESRGDVGSNPATAYDVFEFPANLLQAGDNLLAVRVHQSGVSSDAVFGAELFLVVPAQVISAEAADCGMLSIRLVKERVILGWPSGYGCVLEEADALTGPWSEAAVQVSPFFFSPAGAKFFRLSH